MCKYRRSVLIIRPRDQSQIGMMVKRPGWTNVDYVTIRYVGSGMFIGDVQMGESVMPSIEFWIKDGANNYIDDWIDASKHTLSLVQ